MANERFCAVAKLMLVMKEIKKSEFPQFNSFHSILSIHKKTSHLLDFHTVIKFPMIFYYIKSSLSKRRPLGTKAALFVKMQEESKELHTQLPLPLREDI